MKNIPMFTTTAGVASIVLDQIPFNQTAYIRIQSSTEPLKLLQECLDFCRAVGASVIYAAGEGLDKNYKLSASVIRMTRSRKDMPKALASLKAVDLQDSELFRSIYNKKMRDIPNASAMTAEGMKTLVSEKNAYFVMQHNEMIGIGIADGSWIRTIIGLKKGIGETVLLALNEALEGDEINVELIDSNLPAKRLYERMGFQIIETVSTWYKIF